MKRFLRNRKNFIAAIILIISIIAFLFEKLILDLRGNPGGYLDQCVEIASHFIKEGEIVTYTIDKYNQKSKRIEVVRRKRRILWLITDLTVQ